MIRYTGRGYLGFFLFMGVAIAAVLASVATGLRETAALVTFAVVFVGVGIPLHWWMGLRLSTQDTPEGPVRHTDNLFMGAPVQYTAVLYPLALVVGVVVWSAVKGSSAVAWVVGISGLVAMILYGRWARGHFQRTFGLETAVSEPIPGVSTMDPQPRTRKELAAVRGWRHQKSAAAEWRERWAGYGELLKQIDPTDVLTGELNGYPFTVFDTMVHSGPFRDRVNSQRTICVVDLPVALPDVRLRPTIEDLLADSATPEPVAPEAPWHTDLLERVRGLTLLESGETDVPMVAEADAPGLADALVTDEVRRETIRQKLAGWRIHGNGLIYLTTPGTRTVLTPAGALMVVTALTAVAATFPRDVLDRYALPSA